MCIWEKYNVGSSPDFSVGYVCCSIVLLAVFIRPGMVLSQRQRRHCARGGVTQEITINSIPQCVCRRTEWVGGAHWIFQQGTFLYFLSVCDWRAATNSAHNLQHHKCWTNRVFSNDRRISSRWVFSVCQTNSLAGWAQMCNARLTNTFLNWNCQRKRKMLHIWPREGEGWIERW